MSGWYVFLDYAWAGMVYRICKSFEVENGHMLMKHPGRCRSLHGHTRRIEIVLASATLDENDMVCDFAAVKAAVEEFLDALDHAMVVNSADPLLPQLDPVRNRIVVYEGEDPTTEVMARRIYEHVVSQVASGREFVDRTGRRHRLPSGLIVERVRVGETSSSWAEYGRG